MSYSYTQVSLQDVPGFFIATDPSVTDDYTESIRNHFNLDNSLTVALQLCRAGHQFVDLGANLGRFSLPMAARGAKVLAVEALPQNYSTLIMSLVKNGFSNVTAVHAAVWNDTGVVNIGGQSAWCRVLLEASGICVPGIRYEDLCRAYGFLKPNLVKIDVEGAELAVLKSAGPLLTPGFCPNIIFEANAWTCMLLGYRVECIFEALEERGYRLFSIENGHLVPHSHDDLQLRVVANYLAVGHSITPAISGFTVGPRSVEETLAVLVQEAQSPSREFPAHLLANIERIPESIRESRQFADVLNQLMASQDEKLVKYTALYKSV